MGSAAPCYRVVPFLALGLVTLVISGFQLDESWAAGAWEGPVCEETSPAFGIEFLDESARLGQNPTQAVSSPPVLGQTPKKVQDAWGPAGVYDTQPPIHIYCVGGTYQPNTYDHDGNWWIHSTKALNAYTLGPCSCERPGNLFARYEANKLVVAGYFATHGATYDRGWMSYLDRLIAGVDAYSSDFKRLEEYSSKYSDPYPKILAVLRFHNGSTLVSAEVEMAIHGLVWYAPGVLIDPTSEPLLSIVMGLEASPKGATP